MSLLSLAPVPVFSSIAVFSLILCVLPFHFSHIYCPRLFVSCSNFSLSSLHFSKFLCFLAVIPVAFSFLLMHSSASKDSLRVQPSLLRVSTFGSSLSLHSIDESLLFPDLPGRLFSHIVQITALLK